MYSADADECVTPNQILSDFWFYLFNVYLNISKKFLLQRISLSIFITYVYVIHISIQYHDAKAIPSMCLPFLHVYSVFLIQSLNIPTLKKNYHQKKA